MKLPPSLIRMKVRDEGRTKVRLWLPVFILWPLLLALVVLAGVGTLIADAVVFISGTGPRYTRFLVGCLEVLGESRGVQVCVEDKDHTVAFTLR